MDVERRLRQFALRFVSIRHDNYPGDPEWRLVGAKVILWPPARLEEWFDNLDEWPSWLPGWVPTQRGIALPMAVAKWLAR